MEGPRRVERGDRREEEEKEVTTGGGMGGDGDSVTTTVGGYEIEGLGIQLFSQIGGDLFTIQGLPLLDLLHFLRSRGLIPA